ncbi:hypothetical protein ACFQFC_08120 [Amorphoplanes digitatis]|uniref:Uncharacterized protein n=1 Tax=Actinoplanes digitatis TaxID=1868 RepID=A0A7W7I0M0_9ACTN|nr:hypothetical protein [Actinoplanes digitatis]MBB4764169.1 hypothetical protein [Actinoplanes digitatis]BFE73533.1 hypothetical protein GCM10020092_068340 [Actinoplanes digitatis]GID97558.1 hypothetical protein Adi01nite_69700 [Actinoplanes digitatis]
MTDVASRLRPLDIPAIPAVGEIGGPTAGVWREGTLTRAAELETLSAWMCKHCSGSQYEALMDAVPVHLRAAREAALRIKPSGRPFHIAPSIQRAMSNLDAAEANLLGFAQPAYLLGQMPGLLNHVQRHLRPSDPRRQEFERIAQRLGAKDPDHALVDRAVRPIELEQADQIIESERRKIVTIVRGASSEALREQLRLRSFRNVLVAAVVGLMLLAIAIAVLGWLYPTRVPLCFQPSLESGESVVVCPTAYSDRLPADQQLGPELNERITQAAKPWDHLTVELIGLTAAAIAGAAAIGGFRGSSESLNLPVLLTLLKLPTGALTAFLGVLLIRGQFIPGLSALDTPAQILSWALVFGFAQHLFTRFVDQQGQTVLNNVRPPDKGEETGTR